MRELFRDREHLVRFFGLAAAALILFAILRTAFIPETFGKYGHFRAVALEHNREVEIAHAGQQACAECHEDVLEAKNGGRHATVRCEGCHGPLAKHATDPASFQPALPNPRGLCLGCHQVEAARPRWLPQVDAAEHAGDEACDVCHHPHHPTVE